MSKPSQSSPNLLLLDSLNDFQEHAISLAAQTRRHLAILSEGLDKDVFGQEAFVAAVSQLARSSRFSSIQILVKDTRPLVNTGHKLVQLSQRLSSKVVLRKITIDPDNTKIGFMLCDTQSVLYKNDDQLYKGFANTDAAAEVNRLREQFDYIWQHAIPEPELQQLHI